MLQIRDLEEIKNDPKKVEELLNDDEKELLREYERFMKMSAAERRPYIFVDVMTDALVNLLTLTGYSVTHTANNRFRIGWSWQENENSEVESKQTIKLQDGSSVEIGGANVKHINENGQILYDSTSRVAYNQDEEFRLLFAGRIPE